MYRKGGYPESSGLERRWIDWLREVREKWTLTCSYEGSQSLMSDAV